MERDLSPDVAPRVDLLLGIGGGGFDFNHNRSSWQRLVGKAVGMCKLDVAAVVCVCVCVCVCVHHRLEQSRLPFV